MFKYYNKILLSLYYIKSSDPLIVNGIDLKKCLVPFPFLKYYYFVQIKKEHLDLYNWKIRNIMLQFLF